MERQVHIYTHGDITEKMNMPVDGLLHGGKTYLDGLIYRRSRSCILSALCITARSGICNKRNMVTQISMVTNAVLLQKLIT